MYASEGSEIGLGDISAKEICRTPPRRFNVEFQITEVYDKGFNVSINVDGVLCLTKQDAMAMIEKRVTDLLWKWEEHKLKM